MQLLFSYGTLQLEEIQFATFGRRLVSHRDALVGYEPSLVKIPDPAIAARLQKTHHNNVTKSGNAQSRVEGSALEVTEDELLKSDVYEAEFDYVRVVVTMASGREGWLYVHRTPGAQAP